MRVVRETNFAGISPAARGKVRDIYDLGDKLLIVASDRLSAFDVVLPTGIPDKGRVLTQLSLFWFDLLHDVIPNHVLSATEFPAAFDAYRDDLAGRSMVVRKTQPLPIECVVRGYVSGSGWKDYRSTGKICGIGLPAGLRESDRLPEPIFTPATKAVSGHDENISFEQAASLVGKELAERVRAVSIEIYPARRRMPSLAASWWPTPSLSSACSRMRLATSSGSMKRSLPIPRASGPRPNTNPADRSHLSTNSLCVTTSNASNGRRPLRVRSCLRMLSPRRVPNTGKRFASWPDANWIRTTPRELRRLFLERADVMKDQLEGLVSQMVERGILFDEAIGEFEKRFIKRVLDRVDGNQSRAAHILGIHRNTLSRKIVEYKLDHRHASR